MALKRTAEQDRKLNIETVAWGGLTWIDIEKPTKAETDYLAQNFPFHELDLDDCLSRVQRPKLDEYDDYMFIVLHFPVFNKQARVTTPSQVSIFIGEDYLITLHNGDLKPLTKMFLDCQTSERARRESMMRSSGYLMYRVLDRLVDYCFPILNKIVANIEAVEDAIFDERPHGTVRELSVLRRDVISYRRMIRPQTEVIEMLEQRELPFIHEDPDVYFGDLADHMRKIRDTLDDYKEVIEGLNDTNNSLISSRINRVMRVLTIISTIMLPLSVVSGILGMNVGLPLQGSPFAFIAVMGFMFCIVVGMLVFLRSKRWI